MKLIKTLQYESHYDYISIYMSEIDEIFISYTSPRTAIKPIRQSRETETIPIYTQYLIDWGYHEIPTYYVDASGKLRKTRK